MNIRVCLFPDTDFGDTNSFGVSSGRVSGVKICQIKQAAPPTVATALNKEAAKSGFVLYMEISGTTKKVLAFKRSKITRTVI